MKNIILIGFMGVGKTAVGKLLAKKMGREFVDADDVIEAEEKKTIARIFKDEGEDKFREYEKRVIRELSNKENLVIAPGGGAVLFDENVQNLKKNGIIFLLTAIPEVILERTKRYTHRPLLNVEDPKKKIVELLAYRRPYYEKAADHTIDTSRISVEETANKIKEISA